MMHSSLNRALRWAPLAFALCVLGAVIGHAPGRQLASLPPEPEHTAPDTGIVPVGPALTELATWPLFGANVALGEDATAQSSTPGSSRDRLPDESVVLPTTTLDVQVRGLAYATTPQRAHAILQVNGSRSNAIARVTS